MRLVPFATRLGEDLRLSKEDKVHQHELRPSCPVLAIRRILALSLFLDVSLLLLLLLFFFFDGSHDVIFAQILDWYQGPRPSVKSQHLAKSQTTNTDRPD